MKIAVVGSMTDTKVFAQIRELFGDQEIITITPTEGLEFIDEILEQRKHYITRIIADADLVIAVPKEQIEIPDLDDGYYTSMEFGKSTSVEIMMAKYLHVPVLYWDKTETFPV